MTVPFPYRVVGYREPIYRPDIVEARQVVQDLVERGMAHRRDLRIEHNTTWKAVE